MSIDFDEDNEEINFDRELRQHKSTISKFKDLDVNIRAQKMEALERAMRRATSSPLKDKNVKQSLARDFLEKYKGIQRPDPNFDNFLRTKAGGNLGGGHNNDYEPNITGYEELPWEKEDF